MFFMMKKRLYIVTEHRSCGDTLNTRVIANC